MKKVSSYLFSILLCIFECLSFTFLINADENVSYKHVDSSSSNGVTMKVEWNDPVLGQPTIFHVSATGGSGAYKFRMDAPSYTNPNEMAYESVADPSRGEWMNYTNECNSTDYLFTMTASGTYNFRFYLMDKAAGVYYLRVSTYIQVSDSNHPSVRSIVKSAVAQCNNETDGSDFQKALWLHDWLLNQLEYDNTLKWSSAESALTRGLGTCQAYESAYSVLLSTAGIENAEIRDTYDGHTWNAMKLDGEWYQVDCTWDDSSDNWYNFDQRRLYFGLTDELMAVAHPGHSNIYTVSGYGTRSTTLKNNYFVKSGEAQQWVDSYKDRIQNSLNSKQTQFSIQADNSTYPPSIYKIQNAIIAYVMNQNEWFLNSKKVTLVATVNDNKFDFTVTYPTECTKHDWDEGKVTTEPTCTKDGIKTYTCKNCATTKTETIKALGHDYSNEWTIDKEATCQEEGSKSHHCLKCDDKKDVTTISKKNHEWDNGKVIKNASSKYDGIIRYTCANCLSTKDVSFSHTDSNSEMDDMAAEYKNTLEDGIYNIETVLDSEYVIGIKNNSINDLAKIELQKSAGSTSQQWKVTHDEKGYVCFENVKSGKMLDLDKGKASNFTSVQQYARNNLNPQKWIVVQDEKGMRIIPSSSKDFSLDLNKGSTTEGANIQLYEDLNNKPQRWKFKKIRDTYTMDDMAAEYKNTLEDGIYNIETVLDSEYVIGIKNNSINDLAKIELQKSAGSTSQQWKVTHDEKGYVCFENVKSGKMLDLDKGKASNFTSVQQYARNNLNPQKWIVVQDEKGMRIIPSSSKDFSLDLNKGSTTEGANIQLYEDLNNKPQRWKFKKIEN